VIFSHRLIALSLAATAVACSSSDDSETPPAPIPIHVSGDAFSFTLPGSPYGNMAGGVITVLEAPGVTATADADGHFEIDGLSSGQAASFVITAADFPEAQTKTFTLPRADLERVTFQVPKQTLFDLLAAGLKITPDPASCQIVSTITRVGKSIYDPGAHGEAGATVTIDPAAPADSGPVYFNADVIPDRTLSESSEDGGVVFLNVPAGEYTLTAHKAGVSFEPVHVKCRGGVLVNASPPYGLQAK
jgi:hypothetical protein